jgi:hypothetical protein
MKPKNPDQKIANIAPFGLRMQPELKQQIEEQAMASGRSLNAEIVWRLEQSLKTGTPGQSWIKTAKQAASAADDRLSALEAEVQELRLGLEELRETHQDSQGTA